MSNVSGASPKSCLSCPSMLKKDQAAKFFGKSIGGPMCARYGKVLSGPKLTPQDNDKLLVETAKDCAGYGKMMEAVTFAPSVTEPQLEAAVDARSALTGTEPGCRTCNQCQFYMQPHNVLQNYGWPVGMCQAKGQLILPHLTTEVAQQCDLKVFGANMMLNPPLLPQYSSDFYHIDLFKSYGSGADHPINYVSDTPVTDEHRANGIIAFRKIVDPASDQRYTFLPVYDPDQFTPEDRAKIPQPGDEEHPELYLDHNNSVYKAAICWRELDETPMAWGPAGVGKTEMFRHMAYLMQLPFERFSITASTELDDLAGKMMFGVKPGETRMDDKGNLLSSTYFQKGRLPLAWERKCVILIDEPNTGQPDVWQFLRPLTDNSKQLVLDTSSGEHVVRSDDTYMAMAANPAWDVRNVGANVIGDADASRLMHLKFALPPRNLEKKIIKARVDLDGWQITAQNLDLILAAAADIRTMCEDGTLPLSWGIRVQIKVARALRWFTPLEAYKLATDDLEPDVQRVILEAVKSHFGFDLDSDSEPAF